MAWFSFDTHEKTIAFNTSSLPRSMIRFNVDKSYTTNRYVQKRKESISLYPEEPGWRAGDSRRGRPSVDNRSITRTADEACAKIGPYTGSSS
jgi:hypothetical protein